jgi:hypothetical protein
LHGLGLYIVAQGRAKAFRQTADQVE